jgi:hypothetical protein
MDKFLPPAHGGEVGIENKEKHKRTGEKRGTKKNEKKKD